MKEIKYLVLIAVALAVVVVARQSAMEVREAQSKAMNEKAIVLRSIDGVVEFDPMRKPPPGARGVGAAVPSMSEEESRIQRYAREDLIGSRNKVVEPLPLDPPKVSDEMIRQMTPGSVIIRTDTPIMEAVAGGDAE